MIFSALLVLSYLVIPYDSFKVFNHRWQSSLKDDVGRDWKSWCGCLRFTDRSLMSRRKKLEAKIEVADKTLSALKKERESEICNAMFEYNKMEEDALARLLFLQTNSKELRTEREFLDQLRAYRYKLLMKAWDKGISFKGAV